MKKIFALLLLTIFLSSFLTSCKKDKGNPPTLPPEESMTIDFSNFESGKKSADLISVPKGVENSNWEFAALIAGYFRTLIVGTLAVPVYSFKLAVDKVPAYLDDKTWQWSYSTSLLSVTYKARLTGQIRTTDVLWKMYITREGTGGFPEFLWFEGTSKLDGTGGQWILNHSSQYKEPVLQIDWTRSGTAIGTIRYTYVRTLNDNRVADPFKTSYIEYGKTTGTYNSSYKINYYNGLEFSEMFVEWNSTTRNGMVKCLKYFGDNNWYCWNGQLVNITCPL
ncbi:MAG: hypothetical protein MUO72_20205 [Bacteroidales bacterium]|nr:hypothetical protein [Bacteroidales bacterium]